MQFIKRRPELKFLPFLVLGIIFGDLFPEFKRKGQTLGSGVIISSEGYIITNNHVIDDADKIINI